MMLPLRLDRWLLFRSGKYLTYFYAKYSCQRYNRGGEESLYGCKLQSPRGCPSGIQQWSGDRGVSCWQVSFKCTERKCTYSRERKDSYMSGYWILSIFYGCRARGSY